MKRITACIIALTVFAFVHSWGMAAPAHPPETNNPLTPVSGGITRARFGNRGYNPTLVSPNNALLPAGATIAVDNPIWRIGGSVEALAVAGQYAYLAQGMQLQVVDLSTMAVVGTLAFRYPVRDVSVQGDYIYLVTNIYGDLHVVDVSDPTKPTAVATGEVPGWAGGESVVARGGYAYVLTARSSDGLATFDISSPFTPTLVTQTTGISGRWLRAGAEHLYALDAGQLYIVDVRAPDQPQQVGALPLSGAANLVVVEPYVYVTAETLLETGVTSVDVSTPSNPQTLDSWTYSYGHGDTFGVATSGTHAYVGFNDSGGSYSAIFILDISNPADMAYVGKYQPLGGFYNFLVAGDMLYIAGGPSGDLMPVSIANPTSLFVTDPLYQVGLVSILRLAGDRAYVAGPSDYHGADAGIWVYDMQDPLTPTLVLREDPYPLGIYDLEAVGQYVYLSGYGYGLQILDAADFRPRGSYIPQGVAYYSTDITVNSSLAYVIAPGVGGLLDDVDVIDVSNPDAPDRLRTVETSGDDLTQIIADGDHLYVTDAYEQVLVFDIASPQNPALVTAYPLSGLTALYPVGDYVYAGTQDGVVVLDVSDLSHIQSVGTTFETLNAVKSIDVVNHIAYVASTYAVYALDISDPQTPVKLWEHSGPAEGLAVQGLPPYAMVADGELGLTLYAIADGVVQPATGAVDKVFPETPLVATFAQDMDTSSVTFTCTPDPGGWVTSWEETSQDDVGRELTLWHEPFMEDQDYQFEITGGKTAEGQVVESFRLSFAVVSVNKVYLPVVLRVTQP